MVTAGLVCIGIALLCWPSSTRGSAVAERPRRRLPSTVGGRGRVGAVAATVVVVLVALGGSAAGAVALAALTSTAAVLLRWSAADRRHRRDLVELTATLRMLSRELRAGASAEQAVAASLASIGGGRSATVRVLQELVLPGDGRGVPVDGRRGDRRPRRRSMDRPQRPRPVDDLVVRLVGGWRLATRCGLPLTGLVEGVAAVAQERLDAEEARRAEVAGPRLSGWVLAALPAMGLVLGSGMGVDPLAVLLAPGGAGPVLLVVGVVLTCAGLVWSARLVRR